MNWKRIKVGELGRIITGKTPKTADRDNYNGPYMFVTPSDNMDGKYMYSTNKTLTDKGIDSVKGSIIPAGTVCVSCIGSDLGKVVITTERCVTNQQINSIVVDTEKYDVDFVYYAMVMLGKELNYYSKTSTAVPIVNKSSFSSYEINCPSLNNQKQISSLLSLIDGKIEINNRINQNLYEQIQTVYCKYFDPFSHETTGVLSDICMYSTDKVQITDLSISTYYSTENMQPNKVGAIDASSLPSVSQTTRCHKGDVLVSNIRPYFKKIVYVTEDCGCSTDVLCFVPQEAYSAFLFGTLYMDRFFDYMVAGSKGTKMPRGDKQQIMEYPIVIPSADDIATFNSTIIPMLEQISINNKENKHLAAVRDAILPRLMSGELEVANLEV